jgi:hypothetical protein
MLSSVSVFVEKELLTRVKEGAPLSSSAHRYNNNNNNKSTMTTTMTGKIVMPIETKLDNDYDYYVAKQQRNGRSKPPPPPPPRMSNGGATPLMTVMEQAPSSGTPARHPIVSPQGTPDSRDTEEEEVDTDEALLDLVQLEELHQEAERMKALGNKHMAAQVRGWLLIPFMESSGCGKCQLGTHETTRNSPNLFSSFLGIYSSLQCLFRGSPTFSSGTLLARILVESFGCLALAKAIFCSGYGRSASDCLGTHLWKGARPSGTIAILSQGLRRRRHCL